MKRVLTATLLTALILTACSAAEKDKGEKISIITTIFAPYDFSRAIAGEKADITMLLPPAAESHNFEPTPKDIIKLQNCDVFIYVGGPSENWVNTLLAEAPNAQVVTLMDCVETLEEEIVEGMQTDETEDAEYDEHVWTSPRNAILIVQKISEALCASDAANAEYYRANTEEYVKKLKKLDADFQNVVDNAARKTLVFGDRFPFLYFANAYNLRYFAAFPGCSAETEASAKTIKFLIDKVRNEQIPAVFHIELSNAKIAQTIAEETGAKVLLLHSCHNISKEDFLSGKTYLDIMNENIEALREALN